MRSPPRVCTYPGCNALTTDGSRCQRHVYVERRDHDRRRGSSARRGYGAWWRRYREQFLRSHPLCVTCLARGEVVPATDVDHITPHRGDDVLFRDPSNHQALCHACHSAKTARRDGGFGRKHNPPGEKSTT